MVARIPLAAGTYLRGARRGGRVSELCQSDTRSIGLAGGTLAAYRRVRHAVVLCNARLVEVEKSLRRRGELQ